MSSNFKPWWERVNDYLSFDERKEFLRGATSYRPSTKQDIMLSQIKAGYVRDTFVRPESYTGKKTK